MNRLIEGGYFVSARSATTTGMVPRDMWLCNNLQTALDEALEERTNNAKSQALEKDSLA